MSLFGVGKRTNTQHQLEPRRQVIISKLIYITDRPMQNIFFSV